MFVNPVLAAPEIDVTVDSGRTIGACNSGSTTIYSDDCVFSETYIGPEQ